MRGRRLVLGVSGGVAAYKAAYLARMLMEHGASVRAVATPSAAEFLGPQTLAAVTGYPVVDRLFGQSQVSPHTELGQWAELILIAPATAHTLAKLAAGISGDALTATVLASRAPLLVAPAMHTEMWEHPSTAANIATLESRGTVVVGPASGHLAGGDVGVGRMVEPEDVVEAAYRALARAGGDPMVGRSVVVTAGGTREAIDPVRYIGNRSSGKMGHAIAVAAARRGADVTLVTTSRLPAPGCEVVAVDDASSMAQAAWKAAEDADVAILAAAVADFRPKSAAGTKLRRVDGPPDIVLEPTENILAGIAAREPRPFLVGFAAQTGSLDDAFRKATEYGVDLLVANDVSAPGSGFGTDTNQVTIIEPDGSSAAWPMLTKAEVADRLLDVIADRLRDRF